jgi:hypothetical protein
LVSAVLAILAEDHRSAEIRLIDLVETLDRGVLDALGADRPHGVESQILARAVVAVGRRLVERAAQEAAARAGSAESAVAARRAGSAESAVVAAAEVSAVAAMRAGSAVAATLAAAEAYVRAPGDETYNAYFECATNSYPYGTGEGHYGIDEECEPGSGCFTGAGTLYFAGCQVGFGVVIEALRAELVPWLRRLVGPVDSDGA